MKKLIFYQSTTILPHCELQQITTLNQNITINYNEILNTINCNKLLKFNSKDTNVYSVLELKEFCKNLNKKYTNKKDIVDYLRDLKKCK